MKKNLTIALILTCICLICAFGIAGMNALTEPIIEQNNQKLEEEACKQIFAEINMGKSIVITDFPDSNYSYINKIIDVRDANNNVLGQIYSTSGRNAYGAISLLVGVKDGLVVKSVLIKNEQSFSSETSAHFNNYYANGVTSLDDIDVKSGATYASILIKNMVAEVISNGGAQ